MIKLKSLEFYNSPVLARSLRLDLDLDKRFYVLTGYNGAGKSRIISIITEALSVAKSGKFNSTLSRWVFQASLSNGAKLRAIKMEVGGASKDDIEKFGRRYEDVDVSSPVMYSNALEMVSKSSKARFTSDDNSEVEQHFCLSGGFVSPEKIMEQEKLGEPKGGLVNVNLVTFADESLHFNFPLNGAEIALEGKSLESNIDKTLWILIHAYIAKRFDKTHMNTLFTKLADFEQDGEIDQDNDEVKRLLSTAINELRRSSDLESGPVFTELNKFYGLTNRKLVWRDDTFMMVIPGQEDVPFTDFSKGEKNLLALLLAVSLYGDSAVFLLDEPDLSLHVEWQRMLLPALESLAPQSQFIIGTHSPFLVMNTQSETIVNLAKKIKEAHL